MRGPELPKLAQSGIASLLLLVMPGFHAMAAVQTAAISCPANWTTAPTTPPGTDIPFISAISAGSFSDAWFVGGRTDTSNEIHTFSEYWDGASDTWLLANPTDPPGNGSRDSRLNGVVSFPAAGGENAEAWAVGYWANPEHMLIEHWMGPDPDTAWQIVSPESPPSGDTVLVAIAGSDRSDLWAVGYNRNGATYYPHVEFYDGSSWTNAAVPVPASAVASGLIGVSADAADDVWAVGYQSDGNGYRPLVEHFDGTSWMQKTGIPSPGLAYDVLTDVTAISTDDVWTVGYESDGTSYRPLILHYDGQVWSIVPNPRIVGLQNVLRAIAYLPGTDQLVAGGFDLDAGLHRYVPFSVSWPATAPSQITVLPPAQINHQPVGSEFNGLSAIPGTDAVWADGDEPAVVEAVCPASASQPLPLRTRSGPGWPDDDRPALVPSPNEMTSPLARRRREYARRIAAAGGLTVASDIAAQAFQGGMQPTVTFGAAVGDFAGPLGAGPDGYEDFELGRHGSAPLELWVNQGDGTFRQVDQGQFPKTDRHFCAWGDIGSPSAPVPDGLPDLYCAHGAVKGFGLKANELWIQQPDGSFDEAPYDVNNYPDMAVIDPFGRGRAPVFFYAGDSSIPGSHPLSLFVGQGTERPDGIPDSDRFFYNEEGVLVSSPASGLDLETGGRCAQAVDYDRDGYDDLLVCETVDSSGGLALYRNEGLVGPGGVPLFSDVTAAAGIEASGAQFGLMSDLDGDGCPDLVAVFKRSLTVYLQNLTESGCAGTFSPSWTRSLSDGIWAAAGDVNADGKPDLYILQGGSDPDLMLVNNGDGKSFSSVPVPEAASGAGDTVWALANAISGLSDFLVLNGAQGKVGPVQLIHFSPNPVPSPLTITSGPSAQTIATSANLAFQSTESGVSFDCSLDGADPVSCTSPAIFDGLTVGDHSFAVWSAKSDGDVTAEATWQWSIINDQPPVASDGSISTSANTAVTGRLAASDPDPGQMLTYSIVSTPAHGTVKLDAATGEFTYTAARDFAGNDRFTFKVNDGYEDSNIATESVTVMESSQGSNGGGGGTIDPFALGFLALFTVIGMTRRRRKRATHN